MLLIRFGILESGTAVGLFGPAPICIALQPNGCATFVDGVGTPVTRGLKSTARGKYRDLVHRLAVFAKLVAALLDFRPKSESKEGLEWSPFAEQVAMSWVRAAALSTDPLIPSMLLEEAIHAPTDLKITMAKSAVALMRLHDFTDVSARPLPGRPLHSAAAAAENWRVYMTHQYALLIDPHANSAAGFAWAVNEKKESAESAITMCRLTVSSDGFVSFFHMAVDGSSSENQRASYVLKDCIECMRFGTHGSLDLHAESVIDPIDHIYPTAFVPSHILKGAVRSGGLAAEHLLMSQRTPAAIRDAEFGSELCQAPCITPPKPWESRPVSDWTVTATPSFQAKGMLTSEMASVVPGRPSERVEWEIQKAFKRNADLLARLNTEMRTW